MATAFNFEFNLPSGFHVHLLLRLTNKQAWSLDLSSIHNSLALLFLFDSHLKLSFYSILILLFYSFFSNLKRFCLISLFLLFHIVPIIFTILHPLCSALSLLRLAQYLPIRFV